MAQIIAFSGKSNSGKTTLILKIASYLKERQKSVAIIKHDPSNKAEFDTIGKQNNKDSFKFSQVADSVAVISPSKSTIFCHTPQDELSEFDRIIEYFKDYDYVLIEGLKTLPYPRIIVLRDEVDPSYFEYGEILCVANIDKITLPKDKIILDLNDIESIISHIEKM